MCRSVAWQVSVCVSKSGDSCVHHDILLEHYVKAPDMERSCMNIRGVDWTDIVNHMHALANLQSPRLAIAMSCPAGC